MLQKRRDFYAKQLSQIDEKLAAVESDLDSEVNSEKRLTLTKRAEVLLTEREKIEVKLAELDSENSDRNVRDRGLEKILQKIDFTQAKKNASLIRDRLKKDGGSVLLFLQKSKKQMGHYCVEEVINVIMGDQVIDGQVVGSYRRIPVDLGSAISQCNETEFLIRLASHFNIQEESTDIKVLSQKLREKIRASIDCGTTIFLEINSLDDLLEKEGFLKWFIEEFWKPLIDEVTAISKKYRSKLIVALIADSQILPDRPSAYFCDDKTLDFYKMLELSLPNWTVDDIYDWLILFRSVLPGMQEKTESELVQIAKKIYRDSEGTPESVCVSLREKFL